MKSKAILLNYYYLFSKTFSARMKQNNIRFNVHFEIDMTMFISKPLTFDTLRDQTLFDKSSSIFKQTKQSQNFCQNGVNIAN